MIFVKNLTEFYQIALKNLLYLTDFSPQVNSEEFKFFGFLRKSCKMVSV